MVTKNDMDSIKVEEEVPLQVVRNAVKYRESSSSKMSTYFAPLKKNRKIQVCLFQSKRLQQRGTLIARQRQKQKEYMATAKNC